MDERAHFVSNFEHRHVFGDFAREVGCDLIA